MSPEPLFIISLPRAGSTLLQRLLSQHVDIATTQEPWLLLPLVGMTQEGAGLTCWSHKIAARAINDFAAALPTGHNGFRQRISELAQQLYTDQCRNGERYFLDKTPRYYWIVQEIATLFPNAKFIFLFRNPLQVIASILDTWANGRLHRVQEYRLDILRGIPSIAEAADRYPERALSVHYERFVAEPQQELGRIFGFLDLRPDPSIIDRVAEAQVPGRLGDQTGARQYRTLTAESSDKWRRSLASPYRKWLFARWLATIPRSQRERHSTHGIDPIQQLRDLPSDASAWARVPLDIYDHARSWRKHVLSQTRLQCPRTRTEPT
jgi:hypothetical protein